MYYFDSNTSAIYSLYFSWLFDVEEITTGKLVGVLLSILGVIIVSFQDSESTDSSPHSVSGDVVAILGAVLYSLFTTLLKVKVRAFVYV